MERQGEAQAAKEIMSRASLWVSFLLSYCSFFITCLSKLVISKIQVKLIYLAENKRLEMSEATIIKMALWEASLWPFIWTAIAVGICTAIEFGERAYRYKRLRAGKHAGTYGFYPPGEEKKEEVKQ